MHRWDQPHLYKDLMQFMDQASAEGCQIYAMGRSQRMDLEFNLRSTAMFDLFPAWRDTIALPQEEKVRMLQDQETRAKLREEWDTRAAKMSSRNTNFLRVSQVTKESNRGLVGKRLVDIAAERGGHVVDTMLDIALDEDLGTQFVYLGTMNGDETAVGEIVAYDHAIPGTSDGGAHVDMECAVDFTDVLLGKWVRDRGVLSLEDAVHRLTFKSASLLGLTDRGLLREGMAADVVIFDAESIAPTDKQMVSDLPGGGRRLIQRSDAVKTVIVNGQVLLQDGNHSGALPGRVVTRNGDA
ncbi:MAG: amidohydrolase family protein [Chloroflexi bacterium]|nr:amidohydrolase family protein [Chloroflexota bacterium]